MLGEERNISGSALAKRGKPDSQNAKTVKKVSSKLSGRNQFLKILIGGSNDPDIDRSRFTTSKASHLLFLQHPQEA
jgi:hypothetical protein